MIKTRHTVVTKLKDLLGLDTLNRQLITTLCVPTCPNNTSPKSLNCNNVL